MRPLATRVVLKPRLEYAHMYADDLSTIIGEFHPNVVGHTIPGVQNYLWHTFQRVLTADSWGWVTVDALEEVEAQGEGA